MSYEDDCREYHRKRLDAASNVWNMLLDDIPCNRCGRDRVFPNLTDYEVEVAANALQNYLQKG